MVVDDLISSVTKDSRMVITSQLPTYCRRMFLLEIAENETEWVVVSPVWNRDQNPRNNCLKLVIHGLFVSSSWWVESTPYPKAWLLGTEIFSQQRDVFLLEGIIWWQHIDFETKIVAFIITVFRSTWSNMF